MSGFGIRVQSGPAKGVASKIGASLFFLIFLGMGLVFVGLTLRDGLTELRTWTWKQTNCEIISSAVRDTNPGGEHTGSFYFDVKYRFTYGGKTYTGEQYERRPKSFADYGEVSRMAARFPAEAGAVCYVNPSAPGEAVLRRVPPWFLLVSLFPMVFVAIGAGGIYFTWRPKSEAVQPISDRASPVKGQRFILLFFLVFLLIGCGFLHGFFLKPVWQMYSARSWTQVPCVVISSAVQSHNGEDGDTFSVNILYRYEIDGHEFQANRYNFLTGSSSGYNGKQEVVNRQPPGAKTICYVDPADPTQAVLNRGFSSDLWFGLIPLVFVLVGAGGIIFTLRANRQVALAAGGTIKSISSNRPGNAATPGLKNTAAGMVLLKPKFSPMARFLILVGVALFWNGIVSVFLREALGGWRSGHTEWGLMIFLTPFLLIGLIFIIGVLHSLLSLFNPRPRLRVTPGPVPLGGTFRIQWETVGRIGVLKRLHVRVEGREEATYRRGTTTTTDTSVFANLEIANVTNPQDLHAGAGTVTIPANLMHSFKARNNKITWVIHVHGEIPRWPDVRQEFPLEVAPPVPAPASIA